MIKTIRHLPALNSQFAIRNSQFDETSATARSPIVVGLVILAAAFALGTGLGAVITMLLFKF